MLQVIMLHGIKIATFHYYGGESYLDWDPQIEKSDYVFNYDQISL